MKDQPIQTVRLGRSRARFASVRQVRIAVDYHGGIMETHYEGRNIAYSVLLDGQWYGPYDKPELIQFATETL